MTDTLFEKLQAAYRRGVDFACWHFNTSEEKYMELWEFVPKAAYDYADKETGSDACTEYPVMQDRWRLIPKAEYKGPQADDNKDALIRELVAALKPFAEEEPEHEEISEDNELVAPRWLDATYGQYRAARAALAKAKAAGYEP